MFLALVHVTARAHTSPDQPQGGRQSASVGQSIQKCPTGIAHDLSQFDQTALGVLPGEKHDEPVLQQCSDQLGIQFAQHAPGIGRAPLIDLAVLFPEFV
jgi:hypothetical protein